MDEVAGRIVGGEQGEDAARALRRRHQFCARGDAQRPSGAGAIRSPSGFPRPSVAPVLGSPSTQPLEPRRLYGCPNPRKPAGAAMSAYSELFPRFAAWAWADGGVEPGDEIFADDFFRARIGFGDFIGENFGVGGLGIHAGDRGVGRLIDITHVDGDDAGKPWPQRLFFEFVGA